ncbi:hypothetical protein [Marinomonas algicola]|uniref:hypothetical protein n=1 Tax=Marinomonas algicola TaxID=2773454 RepID=UPI00174C71C5|nr:hypothetical protein [Marinomonas algicola]
MLTENDVIQAYLNLFDREPENSEVITKWMNICKDNQTLNKALMSSKEYRKKTPKTITFHFGFHKTGTTSIQTWLELNKRHILNNAYVYNLHNGSSNPLKFACNNFELGNGQLKAIDNVCSIMKDQIDSFRQNNIIYTDETTLGLPLGFSTRNKDYTQSDVYPISPILLDQILSNFTEYKVNVIVMVRQYDNWLKSIWNQMFKQSSFDGGFDDFKKEFMRERNLDTVSSELKSISNKFSNVTFYSLQFEKEFETNDVKDFNFFKICQIPSEVLSKCTTSLTVENKSI